ncbi:MAG: hypothetical protein EPN98_24220 [Phenylobacterium sp.]|uniref:hypothetical protein n=1 Tax=Phenylobacterium sp. TaxID=1871053 RepID=UPI0012030ADE|nr:hypothetical protein [Phenylobacterium sp.]TAL28104.1 MAG: hypothetical protein EPN98_24220 [Phenylobacterium sp.]
MIERLADLPLPVVNAVHGRDGAHREHSIALAGGLSLRRRKVMDRYRLEIVGAASQRSIFTVLGCFVEIIN